MHQKSLKALFHTPLQLLCNVALRIKTVFNFSETGLCEEYQIPYYDMLPGDPSFDEVKRVVLTDKRRPSVPNRWYRDEVS